MNPPTKRIGLRPIVRPYSGPCRQSQSEVRCKRRVWNGTNLARLLAGLRGNAPIWGALKLTRDVKSALGFLTREFGEDVA